MNRTPIIGLVAVAAGAAVAGALALREGPPPEPPPEHLIRVGVLCGERTPLERSVRRGLALAKEELDAAWRAEGWGVELLPADAGGDLHAARAQLARWREEKVGLVVEALGSELLGECAREVRLEPPLVVVCPGCTKPGLGYLLGESFFRVSPVEGAEARALAEWGRELGLERPAVVRSADARGEALWAAFQVGAAGALNVVERLVVEDPAQVEWAAGQVRDAKPDGLFLLVGPELAGPLVAALDGLEVPLFGPGDLAAPAFRERAGAGALGRLHLARRAPAQPDEAVAARRADVAERWREAGHEGEPDAAALHAYDALQLLARAARQAAGKEPMWLLVALRETQFAGASGRVAFDDDRERQAGELQRRRFVGGAEVPAGGNE